MSDTSLGDSKTLVGQEEPGMFRYHRVAQKQDVLSKIRQESLEKYAI
jgi:hypothetical protein